MNCQFCNSETKLVLDLHHQPPSNSFLTMDQLDEPETYYPLKVFVCPSCWLVQVPPVNPEDIFNNAYPYYSSQSPSNVSHAEGYVNMIKGRFNPHNVLEIGSNDGYMLQWFKERGCEVLGFDPSDGPAKKAIEKGIPTIVSFFSADGMTRPWVKDRIGTEKFDLICGINVLAHQPDINDFVAGLRMALAPMGVITMEFPHVMNLFDQFQFDTIYHEHYSYFSLTTLCKIFSHHGLDIFDVDEIPEHGGSLRIYAQHSLEPHQKGGKVSDLLSREKTRGLLSMGYYQRLQVQAWTIRRQLYKFLSNGSKKSIVAYGAAAKGNTFLNFCGIRNDIIPYVIDRSPHKQGLFLPGSHIEVVDESILQEIRPEYVLILPWNIRTEIMRQLSYIKEWDGHFVTGIPQVEVWSHE